MRTALAAAGGFLAALGLIIACADSPNAPVAQVSDSTSALLVAVLNKVTALQASLDSETRLSQARFDSLTRLLDSVSVRDSGEAGSSPFALEGEARICGNVDFGTEGKLESSLALWGGADGELGVDAYGNGANGLVRGVAIQDAKFTPAGRGKITAEVCAVGTADATAWLGGTAPARGASRVPAASSPVQTLLTGMLSTVTADRLNTAATNLGMDGSHLGSAVDAISSFSLSDVPFGQGAAAGLLNALPLPTDLSTLLGNPASVLQNAGAAVQYAVSKVCDQSLLTGALAQRAADACNLRDQIPSASSLISILQGLNGLPTTVGTLQTDVGGACNAVNSMRTASVNIAPYDVTFPLGIGTIRVFPGFNETLFPGLYPIC